MNFNIAGEGCDLAVQNICCNITVDYIKSQGSADGLGSSFTAECTCKRCRTGKGHDL